MGNDIYMGGVRFTPDFDDMGAPQEQWHELSGGSGEGKVMIALAYQPSTVSPPFVIFFYSHIVSSFRFFVFVLFDPSVFLCAQHPIVPWKWVSGTRRPWADLDSWAIFP